jgi:hypothetical protein
MQNRYDDRKAQCFELLVFHGCYLLAFVGLSIWVLTEGSEGNRIVSPLTLFAHVRLLSVAGGFWGVLQTLQRVVNRKAAGLLPRRIFLKRGQEFKNWLTAPEETFSLLFSSSDTIRVPEMFYSLASNADANLSSLASREACMRSGHDCLDARSRQ